MSDDLGNFHQDTVEELIAKMRRYSVSDFRSYTLLRGELDRRTAKSQIDAAKAQVQSARCQLWAVVAMFLTMIATLAAPWVARISN